MPVVNGFPHHVGRMVWHECTIEVPVDSRVVDDPENAEIIIHLPDGSVKKHPRCTRHYEKEKIEKRAPQEEAEGWQVWTQYNAIQNKTFTSMTNYFTVPTSPPSWSEIPGFLFFNFKKKDLKLKKKKFRSRNFVYFPRSPK